jgi:hypothetical protein
MSLINAQLPLQGGEEGVFIVGRWKLAVWGVSARAPVNGPVEPGCRPDHPVLEPVDRPLNRKTYWIPPG